MKKKLQASMEYLMTYGWALVLIATTVGVLVLVVGPSVEDPVFSSSDPTKLFIKGAVIQDNVATIKLLNVTGGQINVQQVQGINGYYDCRVENTSDTIISGGELEIKCSSDPDVTNKEITVSYIDQTGLLQNVLLSGGGIAMGAPPTEENSDYLCSDGFDNDGDYLADCLDSDCIGYTGTGQYPDGLLCEQPEVTCNDGYDNDGDSNPDCDDGDCLGIDGCEAHCTLNTDCPDPYGIWSTQACMNPGEIDAFCLVRIFNFADLWDQAVPLGQTCDQVCQGIEMTCDDVGIGYGGTSSGTFYGYAMPPGKASAAGEEGEITANLLPILIENPTCQVLHGATCETPLISQGMLGCPMFPFPFNVLIESTWTFCWCT